MSDKRTKENAKAWLGNLSPLRNGFPCWEGERDSKKQVFAPTSSQTSFPESRHPSWRGWAGFTPCPTHLPAQGPLQWPLTSSIPCLMHGAIHSAQHPAPAWQTPPAALLCLLATATCFFASSTCPSTLAGAFGNYLDLHFSEIFQHHV